MPDSTFPKPIHTTPETEQILNILGDLQQAIVQLHPILDLLDPTSNQEGQGMILRLSRLLTAVEARLDADETERFQLVKRLDRQDSNMAAMARMIADMHGIFTSPTQD